MKKNLTSLCLIISSLSFAQVGVNTDTPQATIDITSSPQDLTAIDGALIPRIKADDLKLKDNIYTENQHAALVFVTEVSDVKSPKTIKIENPGFYFYDANQTLWIPVNLPEPWKVRMSDELATLNSQDIYQSGNVAVGTQFGLGTFHVDGKKNNSSLFTTNTDMLDDVLIHPSGRLYIGAKPNELLLLTNTEDKVKVAANEDLDVDYDLATTNPYQAIVHRNIISSGTMDSRGSRSRLSSIAAFEGHTYQQPTLSNRFSWYQQRASIVLRTGRSTDDGGEIWFGTAGTVTYNGANPKQSWFRAVMDEKGYWAYGADPNGEGYSAPTERLDVLYGGLRLREINKEQYTSSNSADRVVVVDANGVLKTRATNARNSANTKTIERVTEDAIVKSSTTLVDAKNESLTVKIDQDLEFNGSELIIKKIDESNNPVLIVSSTNKKIELKNDLKLSNPMQTIILQYYEDNWYVINN